MHKVLTGKRLRRSNFSNLRSVVQVHTGPPNLKRENIMSTTYEKFKKYLQDQLDRIAETRAGERNEPTLGDFGSVLDTDPAIDPPMGDLDVCVCFDDDGNPLNQCDECPR